MNSKGRFFLYVIIALAMTHTLIAQDHLFYVSVQGTWDKEKRRDRAQFGGDNRLVNSYFNNFTMELIRSGLDIKGTGEISFVVNTDGTVDSLVIQKTVGHLYDSTVYKILQLMSGKWRAGQVDGIKKSEAMTIWYSVYKGFKSKKTLEEWIVEGKMLIETGDFKKALRDAENALEYDALNVEATIIKARALANLNHDEKACNFIRPTLKYNNVVLTNAVNEYCK